MTVGASLKLAHLKRHRYGHPLGRGALVSYLIAIGQTDARMT